MGYEVVVRDVDARPTAVVRATTTAESWPNEWFELSSEVWACLRAGGVVRGCPNVMLYRDAGGQIEAEVGVELRQPCPLTGRVVASTLPAGEVAMTVHRGPYAALGDAYDAIADWCARQGRSRTTTRWEVYGPHRDDPAELTTEVYWLLSA
jgi:effector-binding domain-containing protein